MTDERISKTYKFREGGGFDSDSYWYDEWEETFYEGDICPECEVGTLKVSKRGKLYCSEICWEKDNDRGATQRV